MEFLADVFEAAFAFLGDSGGELGEVVLLTGPDGEEMIKRVVAREAAGSDRPPGTGETSAAETTIVSSART